MPVVFSQHADFSGISDSESIHLQDIVHQSRISINQIGTEAVSGSAVIAGIKRAADAEFVADRPFLFLILDRQTDAIWFAGQKVSP